MTEFTIKIQQILIQLKLGLLDVGAHFNLLSYASDIYEHSTGIVLDYRYFHRTNNNY